MMYVIYKVWLTISQFAVDFLSPLHLILLLLFPFFYWSKDFSQALIPSKWANLVDLWDMWMWVLLMNGMRIYCQCSDWLWTQIGINLSDPVFQGSYHGKQVHDNDLDDIVQRARDVGCLKFMVTGSDLQESRRAMELSGTYREFWLLLCSITTE